MSPTAGAARMLSMTPASPKTPTFAFPALPRFLSEGEASPGIGTCPWPYTGHLPGLRVQDFQEQHKHWMKRLCGGSRPKPAVVALVGGLALASFATLGLIVISLCQAQHGNPDHVVHIRGHRSAAHHGGAPHHTLGTTAPPPSPAGAPAEEPGQRHQVGGGGTSVVPAPSRPAQISGAPSAHSWLVCAGPGRCSEEALRVRAWRTDPGQLAALTGDFSKLPGVPHSAYAPVAAHWAARPPQFHGRPVRLQDLAAFARQLLSHNPFETGAAVPYVAFSGSGGGQVVAITQRQLAFLVVNVLMGNGFLDGKGDGLSGALKRCSAQTPKPTGYLYSVLSMLAVLSQELAAGQQGAQLIAATPGSLNDDWKQTLGNRTLAAPTICGEGLNAGQCHLTDFMSGGTPFQAMTDIAGGHVGGGAQLCEIANSQDESAVQFYSEALAFAFFVDGDGMLPVPWTLLGARRYIGDFSGESSTGPPYFAKCGKIRDRDWLNEDIPTGTVNVPLGGKQVAVARGAFVAVASKCSGCLAGNTCSHDDEVNNNCDAQRRHLDDDISQWYQAYEPTMYNAVVQEAFSRVIRRIGTGPWGAGVWWGDSQQYFLTVWLASSLLKGVTLDYYIYDHFCENPGNQCFVLGANGCAACVGRSQSSPPVQASRCGTHSLHDMVSHFNGKPAHVLHAALATVGGPPRQVFDALAGDTMLFK